MIYLQVFLNLQKKSASKKTSFFQISANKRFTQKLIPQFPYQPPANHVDMFLSVNPTLKGSISVFFNLISKLHSRSLAAIRTLWEQDLGSAFSDHMWDSVLDRIHSTSMCARHALVQFKVVHRAPECA